MKSRLSTRTQATRLHNARPMTTCHLDSFEGAPALRSERKLRRGKCASVRIQGFTLMEMLVVLIITSLAAGLLMEASGHVLGLQSRLNGQLQRLRGPALSADWLRQVVQGLQPDYSDGDHQFKGSTRGFAGLTTNSLSGDYGGMAAFAVRMDYDNATDTTTLRYAPGAGPGTVDARLPDALPEGLGGGNRPVALLRWRGNAQRLRYWDERGQPHEDWPPPLGQARPLPSAISLEVADGAGSTGPSLLVVATTQGPYWPTLRPSDLMGTGQRLAP